LSAGEEGYGHIAMLGVGENASDSRAL